MEINLDSDPPETPTATTLSDDELRLAQDPTDATHDTQPQTRDPPSRLERRRHDLLTKAHPRWREELISDWSGMDHETMLQGLSDEAFPVAVKPLATEILSLTWPSTPILPSPLLVPSCDPSKCHDDPDATLSWAFSLEPHIKRYQVVMQAPWKHPSGQQLVAWTHTHAEVPLLKRLDLPVLPDRPEPLRRAYLQALDNAEPTRTAEDTNTSPTHGPRRTGPSKKWQRIAQQWRRVTRMAASSLPLDPEVVLRSTALNRSVRFRIQPRTHQELLVFTDMMAAASQTMTAPRDATQRLMKTINHHKTPRWTQWTPPARIPYERVGQDDTVHVMRQQYSAMGARPLGPLPDPEWQTDHDFSLQAATRAILRPFIEHDRGSVLAMSPTVCPLRRPLVEPLRSRQPVRSELPTLAEFRRSHQSPYRLIPSTVPLPSMGDVFREGALPMVIRGILEEPFDSVASRKQPLPLLSDTLPRIVSKPGPRSGHADEPVYFTQPDGTMSPLWDFKGLRSSLQMRHYRDTQIDGIPLIWKPFKSRRLLLDTILMEPMTVEVTSTKLVQQSRMAFDHDRDFAARVIPALWARHRDMVCNLLWCQRYPLMAKPAQHPPVLSDPSGHNRSVDDPVDASTRTVPLKPSPVLSSGHASRPAPSVSEQGSDGEVPWSTHGWNRIDPVSSLALFMRLRGITPKASESIEVRTPPSNRASAHLPDSRDDHVPGRPEAPQPAAVSPSVISPRRAMEIGPLNLADLDISLSYTFVTDPSAMDSELGVMLSDQNIRLVGRDLGAFRPELTVSIFIRFPQLV
ncbi:hypothetical protein CXG81DRAFT_20531 [Caulochytrium protostelioides]|uniref:Uncharacterized protein n=1 Tax=Caulochytrium protostelioides TaxID=1555241 RepID=A0A4P9X2Z3_9FUNG|nr:hypothetical protein CXG81DRAFT_20531 [Caulochytrium protostelioides]|eukprot:RKO99377.1 hypothetical protein CXG81DRAFT_20531 [Caulochytrium protostelioides]